MERIGKLQVMLVVTTLVVVVLGFHAFGCERVELDALLELKSAINYPNGAALPHWTKEDQTGKPSDCCLWEEVGCGDQSGRVFMIDLYQVRLKAKVKGDWYVNASLFLPFRDLQVLDLYSNSVTGWTHHLRQLTSLQWLDLGDNYLTGMIDVYDIEALENLRILALDGNSIDGFKRSHGKLSTPSNLEQLSLRDIKIKDVNTFMDSLSLFPSLKLIVLVNNNLMGSIEIYGLCRLKSIQILYMRGNGLQGQFPWCLRNLTSLQILDLSQNNLQGKLPSFLANFTALQSLNLSSNHFYGNVENSPLAKLKSLQDLELSNNNFHIPRTLKPFANHSNLKTLWLDNNFFVADETQQPFALKFQLSSLSMSNCNIVAKLPHFIRSQYSLKFLDLSHNSIGEGLPAWLLENNKLLEFLNLSSNSLTGSLYLSRHSHYQLKVLDVSNNQINYLPTNLSQLIPNILFIVLSRNSINVITPSSFGDLKNLSCLDLAYNHVNFEVPKDCFKGCFSLETLILSHNNLGVVPSLSDSTSLKILRLNNNNLKGMIPSGLFPSSLQLLDMSNNNLGGHIPTEFCKFNFLNFLDLSNNRFSGFLPPCFNGSMLAFVFLNKNKLNGPPLPVFKNNTSLVILDLGDNHLSGMVPKWISDLPSLTSLVLRNNNFEGELPNQVCSLDNLSILDLSNNNISGQIPNCLSQLTFLSLEKKSYFVENMDSFQKLNSAISLFNGESIYSIDQMTSFLSIQNELDITTKSHTYTYVGEDLNGMSAFDLSCNNLSGEIPHGIGRMFGVRAVNLSHNKLGGFIPSTLSNLSHIESLDLSYNNLNGSIPSELIQLNALSVFSVTHNNLSGKTPDPKFQFGTFSESSYQGNPYLCGFPLSKDCFSPTPSVPKDQAMEDVDGSFDIYVFGISFIVSSLIMFVGTLIVLYVNPQWRRMWFYFAEMWITWVYYFIVDSMRKAIKTSVGVILRFIHCH